MEKRQNNMKIPNESVDFVSDLFENSEEPRLNLGTRIMSNGVGVIIASDKFRVSDSTVTTRPTQPFRIKTNPSTRPMTLAASTLKNTMILVMPSNTQENLTVQLKTNPFATKTCYTTYTYNATNYDRGQPVVTTEHRVVSNVLTEERLHTEVDITKSLETTLAETPKLLVGIFPTIFSYFNTISADDNSMVFTTMHTILNTVTVPEELMHNVQPTAMMNKNTYYSVFKLTRTLRDAYIEKLLTTNRTLTQIIITKSLPAITLYSTPIQPTTLNNAADKYSTTNSLDNFSSDELLNHFVQSSEVITSTRNADGNVIINTVSYSHLNENIPADLKSTIYVVDKNNSNKTSEFATLINGEILNVTACANNVNSVLNESESYKNSTNLNNFVDSQAEGSESQNSYAVLPALDISHKNSSHIKQNVSIKNPNTKVKPSYSANNIINSLNNLRPVFDIMAGLLQSNLKGHQNNITSKIPNSKIVEQSTTNFSKIHNGSPLYIPMYKMASDEMNVNSTTKLKFRIPQSLQSLPALNSLHSNKEVNAYKSNDNKHQLIEPGITFENAYQTPLTNGGIAISPGEVIKANSDVIIGKPNGIESPQINKFIHRENITNNPFVSRNNLYRREQHITQNAEPLIFKPPPLPNLTMRPFRRDVSTHFNPNLLKPPAYIPKEQQSFLNFYANQSDIIDLKPPQKTTVDFTRMPYVNAPNRNNYIDFGHQQHFYTTKVPHLRQPPIKVNLNNLNNQLKNNEILEIQHIPEVFSIKVPGKHLNGVSYTDSTALKKTNLLNKSQENLPPPFKHKSSFSNSPHENAPTYQILNSNSPDSNATLQQINMQKSVMSHVIKINAQPITFRKELEFPPATTVRGSAMQTKQINFQMPQIKVPMNEEIVQINLTSQNKIGPLLDTNKYNKLEEHAASDAIGSFVFLDNENFARNETPETHFNINHHQKPTKWLTNAIIPDSLKIDPLKNHSNQIQTASNDYNLNSLNSWQSIIKNNPLKPSREDLVEDTADGIIDQKTDYSFNLYYKPQLISAEKFTQKDKMNGVNLQNSPHANEPSVGRPFTANIKKHETSRLDIPKTKPIVVASGEPFKIVTKNNWEQNSSSYEKLLNSPPKSMDTPPPSRLHNTNKGLQNSPRIESVIPKNISSIKPMYTFLQTKITESEVLFPVSKTISNIISATKTNKILNSIPSTIQYESIVDLNIMRPPARDFSSTSSFHQQRNKIYSTTIVGMSAPVQNKIASSLNPREGIVKHMIDKIKVPTTQIPLNLIRNSLMKNFTIRANKSSTTMVPYVQITFETFKVPVTQIPSEVIQTHIKKNFISSTNKKSTLSISQISKIIPPVFKTKENLTNSSYTSDNSLPKSTSSATVPSQVKKLINAVLLEPSETLLHSTNSYYTQIHQDPVPPTPLKTVNRNSYTKSIIRNENRTADQSNASSATQQSILQNNVNKKTTTTSVEPIIHSSSSLNSIKKNLKKTSISPSTYKIKKTPAIIPTSFKTTEFNKSALQTSSTILENSSSSFSYPNLTRNDVKQNSTDSLNVASADDSIFIVLANNKNGKNSFEPSFDTFDDNIQLDYDESISFDFPPRDEEPIFNNNNVLVGGVLLASPSEKENAFVDRKNGDSLKYSPNSQLECHPKCRTARNEVCKNIRDKKICVCLPGFGRMFSDQPCKPTYSFALKLVVDQIGQLYSEYKVNYENLSTSNYELLSLAINDAIDRMIIQSDFRDIYHGVQVISLKNLIESNGFEMNLLLQFSDNIKEKRLEDALKKLLRLTNYSVGGTELFISKQSAENLAISDFNECNSTKLNDCSKYARCFNLKGTYTCSCQEGYIDLTENPLYPGRICSNNTAGCEKCNYRGVCIKADSKKSNEFNENGKQLLLCNCFDWYAGAYCQLNLKILLISLFVLGAILLISFLLCSLLVHITRNNKNYRSFKFASIDSEFVKRNKKLLPAFGSSEIGGCSSRENFEDDAILRDSTSEKRKSSLIHVLNANTEVIRSESDDTKRKNIKCIQNPQPSDIDSLINKQHEFFGSTFMPSVNTLQEQNSCWKEQKDRSLTVMIPRAKYQHISVLPHMQFAKNQLHFDELNQKSAMESHSQLYTTDSRDNQTKIHRTGETYDNLSTSGALVSAGYQVSAIVNNEQIDSLSNSMNNNQGNLANFKTRMENKSFSNNYADCQIDIQRNILKSSFDNSEVDNDGRTAEVRSCDETTVLAATKTLRFYTDTADNNGNDESNTMTEREVGSTFLLPHTHLYRHEKESDHSGFDSM